MQTTSIGFAKMFSFLTAISLVIGEFRIHMTIHALGVSLAAVLGLVSCRVYVQNRTPKTLLLAIAFSLLGLDQVMELLQSLGFAAVNVTLPFLGIEAIHAVSFGAIAFLAAGVLKKA